MEINEEVVEKVLQDELAPDIYDESELIPKLESLAELKGLKVFLFQGEDLKKYFSNVSSEIGVALMASSEENARWNLQNFRKCYWIKLQPKNIE